MPTPIQLKRRSTDETPPPALLNGEVGVYTGDGTPRMWVGGEDGQVREFAAPLGGASIARPVAPRLFQPYFDTGLGRPIWWDGATWVDSDGVDVVVPDIDYDSLALAYYEAGDPIAGSDSDVSGLALRGTAGWSMVIAGGGSPNLITNTVNGLRFSTGRYLSLTGLAPDTADGLIAIVEVEFEVLTGSGYPLNFDGEATMLKANGGSLLLRADATGYSQSMHTATENEVVVMAMELDAVAGQIRYWDIDGDVIETDAYALPSLAPTAITMGQGMTGTVRRMAIFARPASGALPVSFEDVLADFLSGA